MAREARATYYEVSRQVSAGTLAPVYLLMGEEEYYIDKVSQLIVDTALKPEERDFNLDVVYGSEVRAGGVANMARQFPLLAERRVVVVREFQSMQDKASLLPYVKQPLTSTVLVLCHKHGMMDSPKALLTEIRKAGVVMESRRLFDNQLPPFVSDYLRSLGLAIEPQASQMLCEHVGSDLTRLASEMDKLRLLLPKGETTVRATHVEELTGVSKDYNNFELQGALAARDILKANRIVNYFRDNPKSFALTLTLASLFGFFSDVLTAFYAPDRSDDGIARWVGKSTWAARQSIIPARRNYRASKVVDIISEIRETDAKSKGVGGCKTPQGELLRELVYFILH
ncbi:MAG: DNA polymerase III subunit delta [Prevotellaceae bacterium]|nr:DNA polymerase III subunit delta [Prevotellaceae bacterium]